MKQILKLLKGAGWLNLLGMSVAFAAIYIILVQVNFDYNYNKSIKDADRIYIMAMPDWTDEGKYDTYSCRPMAKALFDSSPLVDSYGIVNTPHPEQIQTNKHGIIRNFVLDYMPATLSAIKMFNFEAIAGTFEGMDTNETVAISESAASAIGVELGDVIHFKNEKLTDATVVAIFKDMPTHSFLGKGKLIYCKNLETEFIDDRTQWNYHHYVKLKSAKDIDDFEKSAIGVIKDFTLNDPYLDEEEKISPEDLEAEIKLNCPKFIALPEIHYNDQLIDMPEKGNKTTTMVLLLVAMLILMITLVNYLNFFMAQIPLQLRSVNTRKILGSSRAELVFEMMTLSGVLVLLAGLLSYIPVSIFAQSEYASFISCPLDVEGNTVPLLLTLCTALLFTLGTTIYPALYLTSFSPAVGLKGCMGNVQKGKTFRYLLIGLQFVVSFVFFICTGLFKDQYHTMMNYDMGLNKGNLFSVHLPMVTKNNQATYTAELKKRPAIKDVAWSMAPIVDKGFNSMGRTLNGQDIQFNVQYVSHNFLDFMDIKLTEGRDFTTNDEQIKSGVFIFNETAKSKFNLTLESRIPDQNTDSEVVGFCKDFHYRPLQYATGPFAFYVNEHSYALRQLYIRSSPNASYQEVVKAIQETVHNISPDFDVEQLKVNFFDEELGKLYQKEQKLILLVSLFSLLTIIISLMGIVGLLLFETNYRRKEIGIRRVHGATVMEILQLFNRRYLKILLASFVVAAPVSYFLADYYYSTFAYRAPIHAWIFVAALAVVLLVTVTVVTLCCYRAASANPADSIQNE